MRDAERDLAVCEAATKEPWAVGICIDGLHADKPRVVKAGGKEIVGIRQLNRPQDTNYDNNILFIATAREALPYWIHAFQDLKLEYDHMHHERDEWKKRAEGLEAERNRLDLDRNYLLGKIAEADAIILNLHGRVEREEDACPALPQDCRGCVNQLCPLKEA